MAVLSSATRLQLLALLRQTCGAHVELADYTVANQRPGYLVVLAQIRHPTAQLSIKLADPQTAAAEPFERVAALHRLVATHTSIAMPEIVACDVSCRRWPWRYLIKTYVPGQEWASVRQQMQPHELRAAYRQLAQAIAELHAIRLEAFGELSAQASVDQPQALLPALKQCAQRLIRTPRSAALFDTLLNRYAALFSDVEPASLCHDDLHGHNILFQRERDQWRLATILDFDKAWAGHHETDLARLDLWVGMTSPEFWETYQALHPIASLYQQRRPIYQLLWCLEYAVATPQHLADTQRLCIQLGIPPITRFE